MKIPLRFLPLAVLSVLLAQAQPNQLASDESSAGWKLLFDGKSLDGWRASEAPGTFSVKNGEIVVRGARSHLFYTGPLQDHVFKNFELTAEVLTFPGANSGIYFHTTWQETGWPEKGYEVQVNNSHTDPKRTAGLYGIKDNLDAVAKDGTWFKLSIRVEGRHVVTKVDDKMIEDYTQEEKPERPASFAGRLIGTGTFALQGHDPASETHYKNIKVHVLP